MTKNILSALQIPSNLPPKITYENKNLSQKRPFNEENWPFATEVYQLQNKF
jgi:hypothetical protein